MARNRTSWATVEEKFSMDVAVWRSKVPKIPRQAEERALIEGIALIMPTVKGVATVRIKKLDWELTPPSSYTGHCETKDHWMLVSGSEFKVIVRPHGARALQLCPRSEEVEFLGSQALLPLSLQKLGLREGSPGVDVSVNDLQVDDKLSNSLLALLFDTKEAATGTSQKKRAEMVGEKFSAHFLRCVSDLQSAKNISDVLDAILSFSVAYHSTEQSLQQDQQETSDCDLTGYFYNDQVWEKNLRNSGSLWVRQQVNHAAMKCQTAVAAMSEVATVGAKMLADLYVKPSDEDNLNNIDSEMDEYSDEVNPNTTAKLPDQDGLINGSSSIPEDRKPSETHQHWNSESSGCGAGIPDGPSLDLLFPSDCDQSDLVDELDVGNDQARNVGETNNPAEKLFPTTSFGSSWQSDIGNDTSSESSSWVEVADDEADVLGAEFSDAESLDDMLRGLDPFGKRECSPLIDEFLSLNMNSATFSADNSDQEHSSHGQDARATKVLERLASWSSSNSSSWSDHDILSSASSSSLKKMRTATQLETLAEEPACDPEISRLYRSLVFRAASEGNVLQWCSCKFNKLRCSIELKLQVGSFMEDDIATLSTGLSRESPLHVEIFLDSTNVRESLLKGDVRVLAHQGVPFDSGCSWKRNVEDKTAAPLPVAGLSCYIPHLVRQYLKQEVNVTRSTRGYQFPDGELLTGLMQYVVAQLVFIKRTCCVCNHEIFSDELTPMVPVPCAKNLCQALYGAWLVVAPPVVVEFSTVVNWLKTSFPDINLLGEALLKHYGTHRDATWSGSREEKFLRVANWLTTQVRNPGWIYISMPKPELDENGDAEASEALEKEQVTKRRRTLDNDKPWTPWNSHSTASFSTWTPWHPAPPPSTSLPERNPQSSSPSPPELNPSFSSTDLSQEMSDFKCDDESCDLWLRISTSASLTPETWEDLERHRGLGTCKRISEVRIGNFVLDGCTHMQTSPQASKESEYITQWPIAQGESSSQGEQILQDALMLGERLEPLSLKTKSVASATTMHQAQAGKLSFPDSWRVKRPPQAPRQSRFQKKIVESLADFESAPSHSTHTPQGQLSFQAHEKSADSSSLAVVVEFHEWQKTRISPQEESSSQDPAPSSSWPVSIDEELIFQLES